MSGHHGHGHHHDSEPEEPRDRGPMGWLPALLYLAVLVWFIGFAGTPAQVDGEAGAGMLQLDVLDRFPPPALAIYIPVLGALGPRRHGQSRLVVHRQILEGVHGQVELTVGWPFADPMPRISLGTAIGLLVLLVSRSRPRSNLGSRPTR